MVGLVAVVLVIAGAGSLILTRNAARNQAQEQLVSEADVAHVVEGRDAVARGAAGRAEDAQARGRRDHPDRPVRQRSSLRCHPSHGAGHRRGGGPVGADGVRADGQPRLRRGTGHPDGRPSASAWTPAPGRHVRHPPHPRRRRLGPSWGYFIIAGGAALLVAALVAWQMSRRMARPLVEAMEVTGRIASGELASRVPVRPQRLPRVHVARRLHQRHGPEPRGQPRPGAPPPAGGVARPAHAARPPSVGLPRPLRTGRSRTTGRRPT